MHMSTMGGWDWAGCDLCPSKQQLLNVHTHCQAANFLVFIGYKSCINDGFPGEVVSSG